MKDKQINEEINKKFKMKMKINFGNTLALACTSLLINFRMISY